MNNVRRLLGSTVASVVNSEPPPPSPSTDSPPWVDKGTSSWTPQVPRSSSSVSSIDSTFKNEPERTRDSSSSSTVGTPPLATRGATAPLFSTPGASTSSARPAPTSQSPSTSRFAWSRPSPPSTPLRYDAPQSPSSPNAIDTPTTAPLRSRSVGQSRPSPITRKALANPSKAYSSPARSPRSAYGPRGDNINTRDELLMMLLSSQAVLDSRDFEVLHAEEVDELKTVRYLPSSRSIHELNVFVV